MKFLRNLIFVAIIVTLSMLFTACNTTEKVTITFMADGDIVESFEIEKGAPFTEFPVVPAKEGYLGSWNITSLPEVTRNTTVTAIYTKNFFTATFYVDGKYHRTLEIEYGTNPTLPAVPEKTGYNGTWDITDFSQIRTNKNVNAVYTPKNMKITFKAEGFSDVVVTVPYGSDLVDIPQVPNKTGFTGIWDITDFSEIKSDLTVRAQYSLAMVKVTLIGADENTQSVHTLNYGSMFNLPQTQEKDGAVFAGWFLENNFITSASNAEIFRDTTYYAYWIEDNSAQASPLSMFNFALLPDDTYAVSANTGVLLNGDIVVPNVYNGALVTEIAQDGFSNQFTLTRITLPEALRKIGSGAFKNCDGLEEVNINPLSKVIEIGEYAFHMAAELREFSISAMTEIIGGHAFEGTALTTVNIPFWSALEVIGEYAFNNLLGITAINISPNIRSIGNYAFSGLKNCRFNFEGLNALIEVGEGAFKDCARLPSFIAPNIQRIGEAAFAGCAILAELLVPGDKPVSYYFGAGEFTGSYRIRQQMRITDSEGEFVLDANGNYTYQLVTKYLPTSLNILRIKEGTEEVVEYFADNVFSAHTFYIPASVVTLGKYSFSAQDNDENNLMRQQQGTINFAPNSLLEEIGESAFYKRENFTSVTLPARLKIIGDYAFDYAIALSTVTVTGNDLVYSGRDAFRQTPWKNNHEKGVVYIGNIAIGYKSGEETAINLTFRQGTIAISPYAFENMRYLAAVTVPSTVRHIGAGAFSATTLTSAVINGYGTVIGDGAFQNATSLYSIAFPDAAVMGKDILKGCASLRNLSYYGDFAAGLLFGITSVASTYEVRQTHGESVEYSVDTEKIYFTPVKSIYGINPTYYIIKVINRVSQEGDEAENLIVELSSYGGFIAEGEFRLFVQKHAQPANNFYVINGVTDFYLPLDMELEDCIEITAVYENIPYFVPASLEKVELTGTAEREIAPFALKDFRITEVTFNSGITAIGESAFENCINLAVTNALSDSLLKIRKLAFSGATQLTEMEFGGSLTEIGDGAFMNSGLTSITFPATLEYIGKSAFESCVNLTNLIFAESETSLKAKERAFSNLRITVFNAPDNLVSLGEEALQGNINLSRIVFSAGSMLTELGDYAFSNCPSLSVVELPPRLDISSGQLIFKGSNFINSLTLTYGHSAPVDEFPDDEFFLGALFSDTSAVGANYAATGNGETYYVPVSLTAITFNGGFVPSGMMENFSRVKNVYFENVWSIGNSAFAGCVELLNANLNSTVLYIGEMAFSDCENMRNYGLTEDSRLEYIGAKAFKNNIKLASFILSDNLETLSESVFESTGLTGINLSNVTVIGDRAFKNCAALIAVTLSENLITIGAEAFYNCENALFPYKQLRFLTEIGELAFYRCAHFTGMGMDNIESIGAYAFDGATNIKEVTLPTETILGTLFGNTYYENTYEVFQDASYRIPYTLELVVISYAAESVAPYALAGSDSVRRLEFNGMPPSFGEDFAEGCDLRMFVPFAYKGEYLSALPEFADLFADSPASEDLFNFVRNATGYTISLKENAIEVMVLPDTYEGLPVTEIAQEAFRGNTSIKRVFIPSSVRYIGEYAFYGCEKLVEVKFDRGSSLQKIGDYAFAANIDLTEIELPAALREIGQYAFEGKRVFNATAQSYDIFSSLSRVLFEAGNEIEVIGAGAFANTVSLTEITLPDSLQSLGEAAFLGTGLSHITLNIPVIPARAFMLSELITVTFGDKVSEIGARAFENCYLLTEIDTNKVVKIGKKAFSGDYGLTEIRLGSVAELQKEAFAYAPNILSVNMPAILSIAEKAFYGCTLLEDIMFNSDMESIGTNAFDGTTWYNNLLEESPDGIILIEKVAYAVKGTLTGDVVIPAGTLSITSRVFYGQSGITSLFLPNSLLKIGSDAFSGCNSIIEITMPGKFLLGQIFGSVSYAGSYEVNISGVKYYVPFSLASVTLTGVTVIADYALYGFSGVTTVRIPANTTIIGSYAFYGMSSLRDISLPETLIEIGSYAFYNCENLNISVELPAMEKVGAYAFTGCEKLTGFSSSAVLKEIGENAFSGCSELTTLTINVNTRLPFIFGSVEFTGSYLMEKTIAGENYVYYLPENLETLVIAGDGEHELAFAAGSKIIHISYLRG